MKCFGASDSGGDKMEWVDSMKMTMEERLQGGPIAYLVPIVSPGRAKEHQQYGKLQKIRLKLVLHPVQSYFDRTRNRSVRISWGCRLARKRLCYRRVAMARPNDTIIWRDYHNLNSG